MVHSRWIQSYFYSMSGHTEKCVEKYCELAGITEQQLKVVATPGLDDHQIASAAVAEIHGQVKERRAVDTDAAGVFAAFGLAPCLRDAPKVGVAAEAKRIS